MLGSPEPKGLQLWFLPPSVFALMDHAGSTHKNMQSHFRIFTKFCSDLWSFLSCFGFLCRHCYSLHKTESRQNWFGLRPTSTRRRFSSQKSGHPISDFFQRRSIFSLLRVVEAVFLFNPIPRQDQNQALWHL